MPKIQIYDCGCTNRPQTPDCRTYGTRWRVYLTPVHIILKCRDCGRMHHFELRRQGQGCQIMMYGSAEDDINEKFEEASITLRDTKDDLNEIKEKMKEKIENVKRRGRPRKVQ